MCGRVAGLGWGFAGWGEDEGLAVAKVENPDGFALVQLVGETEISHVRASGRAVHREEAKAGGRDVVRLGIGMRHQLVGLLGNRIQGHRIVHLVLRRVGHPLVRAVDQRRGGIDQMLHGMTALHGAVASLKNIVKADQIAFDVHIRIGDEVAYTGLHGEIDHHIEFVLCKQRVYQRPVGQNPSDKKPE